MTEPSTMSNVELQTLLKLALPPLPQFELPPLPDIQDADLQRQVFTHTSFHAKPRRPDDGMFEKQGESLDNEKLEHVGDSALGFAVTGLLHDLYPTLTPGNATLMKGHLVSNSTIAQLSKRYGLPGRLLAEQSSLYNLRNGENIMANLFEAYIAGVFYSYIKYGPSPAIPTPPRSPASEKHTPDDEMNGHCAPIPTRGQAQDHVELWLRPLFTPIAGWLLEYLKQERVKVINPFGDEEQILDRDAAGAMARLNQWFQTNGAGMPEYRSTEAAGGMWTVRCSAFDKAGKLWSSEATRTNKKAASTVAAYKICQAADIL